jgi:hypothetical protein
MISIPEQEMTAEQQEELQRSEDRSQALHEETYADMASHDARRAAEATGDNNEVRATHFGNMKNNLDNIDQQMHGTS